MNESDPARERLSREPNFSFEGRLPVRSEDASDRVAVLVVHGVAAKVPNREFVNLEAITDLLTFQDEAKLHASYRLNEPSTVKFHVNGLPPAPTKPTPDAGIRYTKMLVSEFNNQPYPYTTRRNELMRHTGKSSPQRQVHVHELFWADLSRPASPKGFHSISAFLRLIYSVCILGPKSLPRESVTERSGLRRFYRILYGVQYVISWMTRLYIPIVATAFLAGIASLYLLTQRQSTVDAGVPVLAGLSLMIGFTVWCCADSTQRAKKWRAWLLIGIICTVVSVGLAAFWFGLGAKFDWRYEWGEFYVAASFLITGSLVLYASSHRYIGWSWGLLLAILVLTIIGVEWSRKPLAAAVLVWTDWFFAAYWYGWLALCALNLFFWLASGVCLLKIKKDFVEHARGLWTACIAGTVPMALCIVVHLGFFEALCLLFRIKEQQFPQLTLPVLPGNFFVGLPDAPVKLEVLTNALMYWQGFTHHPAIQYVYLFLILAGALAFCAALPSVTAEINPRLRASEDIARALGAATTQMFDLLRLSGEIVQRYVVIAIPVVVWHVGHVGHHDHPFPAYWCWIGMAVLGVPFIISRLHHEFRAGTWGASLEMFVARVLIVAACFALPCFQDQINLTWLLSVSTLFILAGVAFLFAPLLSVGVDVTSWLQEYPRQSTPRARILARLIALLDYLRDEGYSGVAIVAHSQGTMVVIEALRYLSWVDPDRYEGFPMSLFTLGSPLRQLYAVRFPWLYDWVGLTPDQALQHLKAPPQIVSWTNAYGAGDYIGRNLWHAPEGAFDAGPPTRVTQEEGENRREFCLGAWAHVHYWDWQNLEVAKELDNLIMALKHMPPAPQPLALDSVRVGSAEA